MLMQENYVVFYESRKLKEHEKNYATHDLEVTTIIHQDVEALLARKKIWAQNRQHEIKVSIWLAKTKCQASCMVIISIWVWFWNQTCKKQREQSCWCSDSWKFHVATMSVYKIDVKERVHDATTRDEHYLQVNECM